MQSPRSEVVVRSPAAARRLGLKELAISIALAALVWAVFGQTCTYGFVTYDDNLYVYDNPQVRGGFTPDWLRYALTQTCAANWHPLTMLTHILNGQFFGLHAGGHHAVNVLLHSIGTTLLFVGLSRLTNCTWRSALVAAIFAVHPLRAESVAWISELKDVLSGVFFFAGLNIYAAYASQPTRRRYLALIVVLVAGLLAKPMLVTFPISLLLLDYWPLERLTESEFRARIREKAPLLVICVTAAVVTYLVQSGTRATHSFPLSARIENAILSYAIYLKQLFWPFDLIVFYPHPAAAISHLQVAMAGLVLALISVAALLLRKHAPYLLMGWLWYLLLLLPVIGLVQVGIQSHADRYTYLPHIGIYLALVWGTADAFARLQVPRRLGATLASAIVVVLAFSGWRQTHYWKNGETLWRHAIDVTPNSDTADWGLAKFYIDHKDFDHGLEYGRAALAIEPRNPDAQAGIADVLEKRGDVAGAVQHWEAAVALRPDNILLRNRLGATLAGAHRVRDALEQWNYVVEQEPGDANARNNVAWILATSPDPPLRDGTRAVTLAQEAIRLKGENPAILRTLAAAYAESQQFDRAVETIDRAIQLAQDKNEIGLLQNLRALEALFRSGIAYRDPSLQGGE